MVLSCNKTFKQNVLIKVREFIDSPANRTVDIVPSLNILTLQLYTWSLLRQDQKPEEFKEEFKEVHPPISQLTKEDLNAYSRFFAEETMRRNIKRDTQAFSKEQFLNILMPGWKKFIDEYKSQLKVLQNDQADKSLEEVFAELRPIADELRKSNKD